MIKFCHILFFSFYLFSVNIYGQCEDRDRVFKCAQFFGDSIIYLNDFDIHQQKRKTKEDPNGQEWDVYLMKGTEYRFALCCQSLTNIVMKLYGDSISEDNPIKSTHINKKKQKYFDFICLKSDVYKISIRYKKVNTIGEELSALGILGFIRKVN